MIKKHAPLVGEPISEELIANLNRQLMESKISAMSVLKRMEGENISIICEGIADSYEYTPFVLMITGKPESIHNYPVTINKDFSKAVPYLSDRIAIQNFFKSTLVSQYCIG